MRNLIYILVLFPAVVFAQSPQGMPPNMPQMDMEQMQKAMTCMKGLDRSAFKGLEEEGKKMEAEIGAMCRSGNRDAAQDTAIAYGKDMMNRPEIQKMRECSKLAVGMMPQMPFEKFSEENKNRHVCDDY